MQIRKPSAAAVGVAVALAVAPLSLSQAQDTASNPWGVKPPVFGDRADTNASRELAADTTIIRDAIQGNLLEVRLGDMARDRADEDAVEEFAQEMVEDHGSMQRQWTELARESGLTVEARLTPVQEATVQRLGSFSGDEFDRAYMTTMIQSHERDVATLQRVQQSARSTEVRELAAAGLPAVQEHLAAARELGNRVGVSSVAALPPEKTRTRRDTARATSEDRTDRRRDGNRDDHRDLGNLSAEDRFFVREVLQDHVMEIRLAERARRQGNSEKTRDFAEKLSKDFEKWLDRWEGVAERHGLVWEDNLGPNHQQKLERLAKSRDRQFDRTYAAIVAENLGSIVPYFQKEGKAVRSAAVRRVVEDELPVIREHLARARQLQQQASARANASED